MRIGLAALLAAGLAVPFSAFAEEPAVPPKSEEAAKPKPEAKPAPKAAPKSPPSDESPLVKAPRPRDLEEALRILEEREVSVDFDAASPSDVVARLSLLSGVNIVLGPALVKEGGDALRLSLRLKRISARQVLELAADSLGLGIAFDHGVVLLTTKKEARGKPVLRLYALGELTMPVRDFPAPDLMLHPAGAEVKTEPEEDRKPAFSDADDILALVKDNTGTGTWEDEGVSGSVLREWLVIRQYPAVHREIAALLGALRAAK